MDDSKAMGEFHYRNNSNKMVILRCIGPDFFFQEKVVFPFEDWLLSCPPDSRIDIWSHGLSGAELLDSFAVEQLAMPPAEDRAEG